MERWTIETGGERGSRRSDDDIGKEFDIEKSTSDELESISKPKSAAEISSKK